MSGKPTVKRRLRAAPPSRKSAACCVSLRAPCSGRPSSTSHAVAWVQTLGLGFLVFVGGLSLVVAYIGGVIAMQIPFLPIPDLKAVHPVDWLLGASLLGAAVAVGGPVVTSAAAWLAGCLCPSDAALGRAEKAQLAAMAMLGAVWWVGTAGAAMLAGMTTFLASASSGPAAAAAVLLVAVGTGLLLPLRTTAGRFVGAKRGSVTHVSVARGVVAGGAVLAAAFGAAAAAAHAMGSTGPLTSLVAAGVGPVLRALSGRARGLSRMHAEL